MHLNQQTVCQPLRPVGTVLWRAQADDSCRPAQRAVTHGGCFHRGAAGIADSGRLPSAAAASARLAGTGRLRMRVDRLGRILSRSYAWERRPVIRGPVPAGSAPRPPAGHGTAERPDRRRRARRI